MSFDRIGLNQLLVTCITTYFMNTFLKLSFLSDSKYKCCFKLVDFKHPTVERVEKVNVTYCR